MAFLLEAATANGAGTGLSLNGPCSVIVHDDSVFDGARVVLEVADTDTEADYVTLPGVTFKVPFAVNVEMKGAYYLRAAVIGADTSTSVTVVAIQ